MKNFLCVLISAVISLSLISCRGGDSVNLYIVDGAPTLAVSKIISDQKVGGTNINVTVVSGTDALNSAILNGSADIAVMPVNLAQKLYNNNVKIKLLTVNIFGCLYVVGKNNLSSLSDFYNKEINLVGRNGTPDISLKYLLNKNGVGYLEGENQEGVKLNYLANDTIIPSLKANLIDYALIGEPLVTKACLKVEGLKPIINIEEEWRKVTNNKLYTQAGVVVSEKISKDEKFIKGLYAVLKENRSFVYDNVATLNQIIPKNSALKDIEFTSEMLDRCSINCKAAMELEEDIEFYLTTMGENFNSNLLFKGDL